MIQSIPFDGSLFHTLLDSGYEMTVNVGTLLAASMNFTPL